MSKRFLTPGRASTPGFTLLELLIVVAIIGILAAILLPALARARESARRVSCLNNLSELGLTIRMFAQENDGRLPWSGGKNNADCLLKMMGEYITDPKSFMCPSDPEASWGAQTGTGKEDTPQYPVDSTLDGELSCRISYDYFGAYTAAPIVLPPPEQAIPKVPVMWDISLVDAETFNHVPGGGNVLWLDGSIEFLHTRDWAASNLPYRPAGIAFDDPATFPPPEDPTLPPHLRRR